MAGGLAGDLAGGSCAAAAAALNSFALRAACSCALADLSDRASPCNVAASCASELPPEPGASGAIEAPDGACGSAAAGIGAAPAGLPEDDDEDCPARAATGRPDPLAAAA